MTLTSKITIETIHESQSAYPSQWYLIGYDQEHYVYILLAHYRSNLLYISVIGTDNKDLIDRLGSIDYLLYLWIPEAKNDSEMSFNQFKRLSRYVLDWDYIRNTKTVNMVDKLHFNQVMYKIEKEPTFKLLDRCLHEESIATVIIDVSELKNEKK